MSESESADGPRRSQRDKRQAKQFISGSPLKRKRSDVDSGEESPEHASDPEDHVSNNDAEDEEPYAAPKPKPKAAGQAKRGRPKGSTTRPRAPKGTVPKPSGSGGKRGRKAQAEVHPFDAEAVAKETRIHTDNALFNALMNPSAALQSTVEDYLETLTNNAGQAQAELVNCMLRACGCNDSVNEDEVVDYDGVLDALDNFTEVLKQDDSPIYPLTSKLPMFKKFRKSLTEFLDRLIVSAADLGLLYSTDLMATFQTWIAAMSSSQLRSFRHTATVVALDVETALCDVAAAVEKEAELIGRQREGEKKRKAGNKGKGADGREKELEKKAEEIRQRRAQLAEFLKEFIDGVFVHRYRDLDPAIRAECVRSLGMWFKKYPGHFLDGNFLRYVGWLLSDSNTHVRLEAIKSLAGVYEKTEYISSLRNFTERFKPRLIQMATGDIDLSVRVAVIQVLSSIDGHGLLDDDQRDAMCLLVYDEEARVRKAVSGFVQGVWNDLVEERMVGRKATEQETGRAGVKALGILLVKLGKALDKVTSGVDEEDTADELNPAEGSSRPSRLREFTALVGVQQKSRMALAVEALWDEVEPVGDWEALLDVLLLDHSAEGEGSQETRNRRLKGKQTQAESGVDEAWRLEEVEEAALLEVFVAALRKAQTDASSGKKTEDETISSNITRALIKGLPRLFAKHQADEKRIAVVLVIPQLMNLDLYLEMRMMTAYSSLWDDIIKQFTSHSSPMVLSHAVATIQHLMNATSLSNTNSTKILELEDELATLLRDSVAGRDELEIASFSEDEVLKLGVICARLAALAGTRDLTSWMEEDEGGKQSSAWDIVSALAERGKLGYKEEETMITQGLRLLTVHIMWKARRLPVESQPPPEEVQFRDSFIEQRQSLLEKLVEYSVGTQSNTADGVRRAAFHNLMNLHILFNPSQAQDIHGNMSPLGLHAITLDDEVQFRCAGFVQAEVERYAEELEEANAVDDHPSENGDQGSGPDTENSDDETRTLGKKKQKAQKKGKPSQTNGTSTVHRTTRSQLEKEYAFMEVVSTFLRAIRAGALHVQHSASLLVHHGRLGPSFDVCLKVIVDILREEGMYNEQGDVVTTVVTNALREAFTLYLEGVVGDETHAISLAKLLVGCLMIRGAQLSIVRKLDSVHVVAIHTTLLSWAAKRIGAFESNKNKKARNSAILFFKVLQPLLAPVDSRDGLKIKAHMDQVLAQAKLEVLSTSPVWEPQRAYERRLTNAMAKAKGGPGRPRKTQEKARDAVTTDEEEGGQSADEAEFAPAPAPAPTLATTPRPRPRARPVRRTRASDAEASAPEDGDDGAEPPEEREPPAKRRGAVRGGRKQASPTKTPRKTRSSGQDAPSSGQDAPSSGQDAPSSGQDAPSSGQDAPDADPTPKASKKRPREEEEEQVDAPMDDEPLTPLTDERASLPAVVPPSPASSTGEIHIRRKRARR
ncbi:hypothetical protein OF83DRAFT_1276961 [Amylostereum chailletii]|nr:hypothetical protein OF83DRAFT_1276961 [Amylostereum chailletii]